MGKILSDITVRQIRILEKKIEPYTKKGWMVEGSDAVDGAISIFFNNDTDECFFVGKNGEVIQPVLSVTPTYAAALMARIESKINKLVKEEVTNL